MATALKWYTERGNCIRAARKALGKTAQVDKEFTLEKDAGLFAWKAIEHKPKEPAAPKEPKKPRVKGKLWEQPAMRDVIDLMLAPAGTTVEAIANKRKCNKDTARGMVSRLRQEVKGITMGRVFKKVTYFLAVENLPEGYRNENAAE